MQIYRIFILIILLFFNLTILACSRTWPSVSVDNQKLGHSEIARIVRNVCCEKEIAVQIRFSLKLANAGRSRRESAQSIGFICESPPSQTCRYSGERKYQFYNLPEGHEEIGKVHIIDYLILLPDCDDQDNVRVQQKDSVAPYVQ